MSTSYGYHTHDFIKEKFRKFVNFCLFLFLISRSILWGFKEVLEKLFTFNYDVPRTKPSSIRISQKGVQEALEI